LLVRLAIDPEPIVRRTMAVSLGIFLARLELLDAYYLLASWACAPRPELRWAAACALCRPFALPGARDALAHLLVDPDPLVRRVAAQAARRHGLPHSGSSPREGARSTAAVQAGPGGSTQSPRDRPGHFKEPPR
jgi:hypothetical protein